ncbi:MAG: hypothetical protein R3B06_15905 [Kofleriaceae bacterium]
MRRLTSHFFLGGLAALAAAVSGCGDNSVTCGDGTHDEGGYCLPDNTAACGTGTIEMNGTCVPDGSVVCVQGTVFDPATGTCVVDPSACADGTTLVGGECIPDDDLLMGAADHVEAAEPNAGPAVAGSFDAPGLDASTTFYGCITAYEDADSDGNLDADYDAWLVNASGPMVLEVTTDGIHGLSAGFIAVSADAAHPVELDSWQRIGINLTGDTAKREIYLPAAGRYALFVTDARSLFLGDAGAGNADTCYFATVKQVAMPTAVPLTTPVQASTDDGKVKLFTYTGAEGGLLDLSMNTTAPALSPAFVSLRGTTLHKAAAGDPPFDTIGGLAAGDVVSVIVDSVYNYGVAPQAFTIDSFAPAAQALPTDGSTITVTDNNVDGATSYTDINYSYFDVATAGVKRFDVTASIPVDMVILRRDIFTPGGSFDTFASIDGFLGGAGTDTFTTQFIKFLTPGRYYFATLNPAGDNAGGTYTITSTVADVAVGALTYGTDSGSQTLATTSGFHSLDLTNPEWIEYGVTGTTDWGTGNVAVDAYPSTAEGWLRTGTAPATPAAGNTYPDHTSAQPAVAPFAPTGRIMLGDARDFLLRVRPTATPGAAATYSLLVGDRPHVTLGPVVAGTPLVRTNMDPTAAGAVTRYLVTGQSGDRLTAAVTPTVATVDIAVSRRNRDESIPTGGTANAGGNGATESVSSLFANGWVAFTASNLGTATTNLSLNLTATLPIQFVDICATGTELPAPFDGNADDDYSAVQTLPAGFTFPYFGQNPTEYIVAGNGFMVFGNTNPTCSFGCFSNGTIPSATQPNGIVAPYWDDLDTVQVCVKEEATKVTVQWTGNLYNSATTVQFQTILNSNGQIDFVYGPNQAANGSSATVGAESIDGATGIQLSRNVAGSVAPSSSISFTTP